MPRYGVDLARRRQLIKLRRKRRVIFLADTAARLLLDNRLHSNARLLLQLVVAKQAAVGRAM